MKLIKIYDTTLRDGTQAEDISFSVEDKIRIAERLDDLGVHYIEGGWPGSNPKDAEFFKKIKKIPLKNAKVVAFGSTKRPRLKVKEDPNLKALVGAKTEAVTIFGKSWDLHVKDALRVSLKENLNLIRDSISYLNDTGIEVLYDAEHFFNGYKANPEYALETLKTAEEAGAGYIILCDTNGSIMPGEIGRIFKEVKSCIKTPLGIHAHNDSETAVANTIVAVENGAVQVQGTINGYGERCGNANLCSIIPNIKIKLGFDCISDTNMKKLRDVSRFVDELANLGHFKRQPYVGDSAFAHKAGIHVSAVLKNPLTYEHINPEVVGNYQRVLISDLSGKGNVIRKAKEFNIKIEKDSPRLQDIVNTLKDLENQGFQFEGAEGSFELLMRKALGSHKKFFDLIGFRVIVERRKGKKDPKSEATIMVKVGGKVEHTAATGNGPVNALDNALRKALERFYPALSKVKLIDYKVRVLAPGQGTSAMVRVLIESGDDGKRWGTVGVSKNIIDASWQALVDSIEYRLLKEGEPGE